MENKKVRIAIIGAGDHSLQSHVKPLLKLADICEIVAVCDPNHDNAKKLEDMVDNPMNLHYFNNLDSLLEFKAHELDAAFILTPDRFHTEQLLACIDAGLHVFCEKPLALNSIELSTLRSTFEEAKSKGLIVSTCHPRRFDTPFQIVKSILRQLSSGFEGTKELGKVMNFDFRFLYHKPSKHGLHPSLMFDHLNHEIDLMNFLFGFSNLKHIVKHYDDEVMFHVSGMRKDDISFSFTGSRKLDVKVYAETMRITFEKGAIEFDMHTGLKTWYNQDNKVDNTKELIFTVEGPSYFPRTDYDKRFLNINKDFLEAILNKKAPYITAQEMLMNTQIAIDLANKTFIEY